MVLEGVHLVPGMLDERLRARCIAVEAVIAVSDERLHRSHFALRGGDRPADRYLARFGEIRKLQDHLTERANERGVAVIDNTSLDRALTEGMELVLRAAGRVASSSRP